MKWLFERFANAFDPQRQTRFDAKASLKFDLYPGKISCSWVISRHNRELISKLYQSMVYLRLRELSSRFDDYAVSASIEVETSVHNNEAVINLPTASGLLVLELGCKDVDGTFMLLDELLVDLGFKILIPAPNDNWFSRESPDIHQKMYERSAKYSVLGGSELFSSRLFSARRDLHQSR